MASAGIYNEKNVEINVNQRLVLTPINDTFSENNKQKQVLIDELFGSLQGSDMTLEEIKEERLLKYETVI